MYNQGLSSAEEFQVFKEVGCNAGREREREEMYRNSNEVEQWHLVYTATLRESCPNWHTAMLDKVYLVRLEVLGTAEVLVVG